MKNGENAEMMKKRRKRTGAGLILMILGAGLTLAGAVLSLLQPDRVAEYAAPAPAASAGKPVQERLKELEPLMDGLEWTAALRMQNASISGEGSGRRLDATLYGVSEGYFDLRHETLLSGRYITGEDIRSGRKTAVVSKNCADALYPGADPLGRFLNWEEERLEIVGVTAGIWHPGESNDALIWIPVSAADTENRRGTATLEVRVRVNNRAAAAAAKTQLTQWAPEGTTWDWARLKLAAFMPLWLTGAAAGFLALRRLIRVIAGKEKQLAGTLRERMKTRYPGQMKGAIVGASLLGLLLAALIPACVYGYLAFVTMPLYTFTDWIPEAFLDPGAVITTAKALLSGAAVSVEYRTAGAAAFGIFAAWISAGTLLFAAGLVSRLIWRKLSGKNG